MKKFDDSIFEDTEVAYRPKSTAQLLKAKAMFGLMASNKLVKLGSVAANWALALHLPVSTLFKITVYNHFCGGETFNECKKTIKALSNYNVGVLLNYGVELKETDEDFDTTIQKNLEAIAFAAKNPQVKALCIKITGFGRFGLFEKIQEGAQLDTSEMEEFERVKKRLDKVCKAAHDKDVTLYVDAEESWIQQPLDEMVEAMMQLYNSKRCVVFNTFQIYRWDRLEYLRQQIEKAKSHNYLLGAKLVRGAYMEKERERADAMGYKSPIHTGKKAVDKDFDDAVKLCLDDISVVHICIASQSEKSNLLAMQAMHKKGIPSNTPAIVFSQLYGMGDNITFNMAELGFNATKYLPYGPVKDVIPYLIRRAQENTSVAGQTTRELSLIKKEINRRSKEA